LNIGELSKTIKLSPFTTVSYHQRERDIFYENGGLTEEQLETIAEGWCSKGIDYLPRLSDFVGWVKRVYQK